MSKRFEFPNHILKTKVLSKTKTVLIYRRNNLTISDFQFVPNKGFVFEEEYSYKGFSTHIKVYLNSNSIGSLFSTSYPKNFKIKGGSNRFGIIISVNIDCFIKKNGVRSYTLSNTIGDMQYSYDFNGEYLLIYYDNPKAKRKKARREMILKKIDPPREDIPVPKSVSWAASHPFQGGSVTPR